MLGKKATGSTSVAGPSCVKALATRDFSLSNSGCRVNRFSVSGLLLPAYIEMRRPGTYCFCCQLERFSLRWNRTV